MDNLNLPIPPDEPIEPGPTPDPQNPPPSQVDLPKEQPKTAAHSSAGAMLRSKWGITTLCALLIAMVWAVVFSISRKVPEPAPASARLTRNAPTHSAIKKQPTSASKISLTKASTASTKPKKPSKSKSPAKKSKRKPWLSK